MFLISISANLLVDLAKKNECFTKRVGWLSNPLSNWLANLTKSISSLVLSWLSGLLSHLEEHDFHIFMFPNFVLWQLNVQGVYSNSLSKQLTNAEWRGHVCKAFAPKWIPKDTPAFQNWKIATEFQTLNGSVHGRIQWEVMSKLQSIAIPI